MSLKEGPDSSISVPDKRQSGIERPGSVGPSAFASRVSQGGLSYIRWPDSFVPDSVPSNKLFSSRYRSVKVCNATLRHFLRQKWNSVAVSFLNLNFIDKCLLRFMFSMQVLCWIIYLCYLWIQMARSSDRKDVEPAFESRGIIIARWIIWWILFCLNYSTVF